MNHLVLLLVIEGVVPLDIEDALDFVDALVLAWSSHRQGMGAISRGTGLHLGCFLRFVLVVGRRRPLRALPGSARSCPRLHVTKYHYVHGRRHAMPP